NHQRRPGGSRHRRDRSAEVVALRPPSWDWSWAEDGALALDRHALREEGRAAQAPRLSQGGHAPKLKDRAGFVTVPRMPAPSDRVAVRRARTRPRPRRHSSPRRLRRLAVLVIVVGGLLGTLLVTAFGQGAP